MICAYSVDYSKITGLRLRATQMAFERGGCASRVAWYRTHRDVVGTAEGACRNGKGSAGLTDEQPMTRWLITGAHGQLGSDLRRVLADEDVTHLGPIRSRRGGSSRGRGRDLPNFVRMSS